MKTLRLQDHELHLGDRTLIMGIVNATPDSFLDRGRYFEARDPSRVVDRSLELIDEGADIIDIGGETAQPTSAVVEPDEEIRRVVPPIERLSELTDRPISVDTYKPEVAEKAIEAGASLVNDTSGLADERLAEVAARTGAGIVVMHIPCHPKERIYPGYADPIGSIRSFFETKIDALSSAGVAAERILLDPGVGFGKTPSENLEITANLGELKALGYPILYACSRRTFLGDLMGGQAPEQRLEATIAVNSVAVMQGVDVIRVHDVEVFRKVTTMLHEVKSFGRSSPLR